VTRRRARSRTARCSRLVRTGPTMRQDASLRAVEGRKGARGGTGGCAFRGTGSPEAGAHQSSVTDGVAERLQLNAGSALPFGTRKGGVSLGRPHWGRQKKALAKNRTVGKTRSQARGGSPTQAVRRSCGSEKGGEKPSLRQLMKSKTLMLLRSRQFGLRRPIQGKKPAWVRRKKGTEDTQTSHR